MSKTTGCGGVVLVRDELDGGLAEFEAAHIKLHEAGRSVMQSYGCRYASNDAGQYEQHCPVSLAHLRFGFSPEMVVGGVLCSICGQDPVGCEHIVGRGYTVTCEKVARVQHLP